MSCAGVRYVMSGRSVHPTVRSGVQNAADHGLSIGGPTFAQDALPVRVDGRRRAAELIGRSLAMDSQDAKVHDRAFARAQAELDREVVHRAVERVGGELF